MPPNPAPRQKRKASGRTTRPRPLEGVADEKTTMTAPKNTVDALTSWFLQVFPGGASKTRAEPDREVVVFSVTPHDASGTRSFEVTDEALNDHPPESIIRDLERQRIPALLKRDPTLRPRYSTDRRIPHVETREVRCDRRTYRVVRDSGHNVVVYDSKDRRLAKTPTGLWVMDASIFARPKAEWCQDIRNWRGPSQ